MRAARCVALFLQAALSLERVSAAQAAVVICVGPHVDRVIPGDWRHGVKDVVVGATPDLLAGPGGRPTGGKLPPGGAFLVGSHVGGFYRLIGTRYSPPFPEGASVGWVAESDMTGLALRNCN